PTSVSRSRPTGPWGKGAPTAAGAPAVSSMPHHVGHRSPVGTGFAKRPGTPSDGRPPGRARAGDRANDPAISRGQSRRRRQRRAPGPPPGGGAPPRPRRTHRDRWGRRRPPSPPPVSSPAGRCPTAGSFTPREERPHARPSELSGGLRRRAAERGSHHHGRPDLD